MHAVCHQPSAMSAEFLAKNDQLHEEGKLQEALVALDEELGKAPNAECLWRKARALFDFSDLEQDKDKKKALLTAALEAAEAGLKLNAKIAFTHKCEPRSIAFPSLWRC